MTTLAIPVEIVGDMDTIRARKEAVADRIMSAAICLGRQKPLTRDYHLADLIERTARYDVLAAEYDRRWLAYDLAHSGIDR